MLRGESQDADWEDREQCCLRVNCVIQLVKVLKFPKRRRMLHKKCPKLADFLNELADKVSTVVSLTLGN